MCVEGYGCVVLYVFAYFVYVNLQVLYCTVAHTETQKIQIGRHTEADEMIAAVGCYMQK